MCARRINKYSEGKNVLDEVESYSADLELFDLPDPNPMIQYYFFFDMDPLSDKKNSPTKWLILAAINRISGGGGQRMG